MDLIVYYIYSDAHNALIDTHNIEAIHNVKPFK